MFGFKKKRVYLDFASITPTDKSVIRKMNKTYNKFANPSSLYLEGIEAKRELEKARNSVGKYFNITGAEIIFTSGGTEANNLAILGIFEEFKKKQPEKSGHFIFSTIEHVSVLSCASFLESKGALLTFISPENDGVVSAKKIREALREDTILVSIQYVNNEIGSIQPISEIAKEIRHFKKRIGRDLLGTFPHFHTDACQAANILEINMVKDHLDLLSLDGGKIYGPRGVGVLIKKKDIKIRSRNLGGGQEFGYRHGTENLPGAVGFSEALKICGKRKKTDFYKMLKLKKYLINRIQTEFPNVVFNGSLDLENSVPFICNIGVRGILSEFWVLCFDKEGVAVSSGASRLNNKEESSSFVVREINPGLETSSIRVSFGRGTTKGHIDRFLKVFSMIKSRHDVFQQN